MKIRQLPYLNQGTKCTLREPNLQINVIFRLLVWLTILHWGIFFYTIRIYHSKNHIKWFNIQHSTFRIRTEGCFGKNTKKTWKIRWKVEKRENAQRSENGDIRCISLYSEMTLNGVVNSKWWWFCFYGSIVEKMALDFSKCITFSTFSSLHFIPELNGIRNA